MRKLLAIYLVIYAILASTVLSKKAKRKKAETSLSGVVSSRLKWRQEDINLVSAEIDLTKHSLFSSPVVFTSASSKQFSTGLDYDLDLSFMDEYSLSNLTGFSFPVPELITKNSFTLHLKDRESNMTATNANSANYKIRYLLWTRDHPSQELLFEKYEDIIDGRDMHALNKLSYLDMLEQLFAEDKSVVKPLLGKNYVVVS